MIVLAAAPVLAGDPAIGDDDTAGQAWLADPSFLRMPPIGVAAGQWAVHPPAIPISATLDSASAADELDDDPFESINRYAHTFNGVLRRHLLEPATDVYLRVTSRPVQKGIANVFANLREPITVAANLLLGDTLGANDAAARFVINTTAGVGGYYDPAGEDGHRRHPRTLEEVLCRYGVPAGPYVVLPILGPATVRDAAGRITTLFIQYVVLGPVYIPYRIADIAIQYVEVREQIRYIESHSIDPYAAQRSAHKQLHARLACNGQTAHVELFGQ